MSDNANKAAWLTEAKQKPLKVDHAPMPTPGPDEIVIKNKAVAVNPVDWKIQDSGYFIKDYPNILGERKEKKNTMSTSDIMLMCLHFRYRCGRRGL